MSLSLEAVSRSDRSQCFVSRRDQPRRMFHWQGVAPEPGKQVLITPDRLGQAFEARQHSPPDGPTHHAAREGVFQFITRIQAEIAPQHEAAEHLVRDELQGIGRGRMKSSQTRRGVGCVTGERWTTTVALWKLAARATGGSWYATRIQVSATSLYKRRYLPGPARRAQSKRFIPY